MSTSCVFGLLNIFLFQFHDLNIYLFVLGYLSQMAYFLTFETYCQTEWSTFLKDVNW